VLSQPFPVFALVGPVTVDELRSTMRGAEVELDRDQLAYLALDEGIPAGA
jgi:aryl-alcohol dehydrogenase-like predicted oxidoreductase